MDNQHNNSSIEIICPNDNSLLTYSENYYKCGVCEKEYPISSGVLKLLEKDDDFYEGSYLNQINYLPKTESIFNTLPLWLINSGYPWQVRKYVPENSTVVELGCAGGVKYFGNRFRMIGVDLSNTSLQKISEQYTLCLQADAAKQIPLPDNSVDAVISSYFWEHIPPNIKPNILDECNRILKPNGKIIFLYDVETANPLLERLKKDDPELYIKLFIDKDGHLGYQTWKENEILFTHNGFKIEKNILLEKSFIQSNSVYAKLKNLDGMLGIIGKTGTKLSSGLFFIPWTTLVRVIDSFIGRLLPNKWARITMTIAVKN